MFLTKNIKKLASVTYSEKPTTLGEREVEQKNKITWDSARADSVEIERSAGITFG